MAQNSKIEWTHHTANLWWGCEEVHEDSGKNCKGWIHAKQYLKDKFKDDDGK